MAARRAARRCVVRWLRVHHPGRLDSVKAYKRLRDGSIEEAMVDDAFRHREENPALYAIARTRITDEIEVSTCFLQIDHNFSGVGKPVLLETAVFEGSKARDLERYDSEAGARVGQELAVAREQKMLGLLN